MSEFKGTPGVWEYVPSNEHCGPYIASEYGSTICDFYLMSHPADLSVRNGGKSKPVHFMAEMADHNARLAAAAPELLEALKKTLNFMENTESEFGIKFDSADQARAAIAKALGTLENPND